MMAAAKVPTVHDRGTTLPALLKHWSNINPETPAYIFTGEQTTTVLSRRDVFSLSGKMSAMLHRFGVCKGDVVAHILPNCPERLICEFGVLMVGGISQTALGYLNNADDTFGALNIAQTTTILTNPSDKTVSGVLEKLFTSSKATEYGLEVQCPFLPCLKRVIYIHYENGKNMKDQLEKEKDIFIEDVRPCDYAVIIETSGTTGICKQIPHTHSSIVRFGQQLCFLIEENGSPFYNNRFFGWFPGYPCVFPSSGITRVVLDARDQNLPAILDVIRSESCRSAFLVPSEIEEIVHSMENFPSDLEPLEVVLTGGQPISKKSMRIIGSLTKCVVCRYGMSETMCICHLSVRSQADFGDHCVGYPMPSYHVRVVDNSGADVVAGCQGIILVKGEGIFNGYLRDQTVSKSDSNGHNHTSTSPNSTIDKCSKPYGKYDGHGCLNREAFTSDGWFRTDDLGFFDASGKLFVHGRGSDAIMHGDEILYPYWLEKLGKKCPAVDDIAIVSVSDPVMYHDICACIIPAKGYENPVGEVKAFMAKQFADIAHGECSVVPNFYLLFEAFPMNRNRKLKRKELSRLAEDRLKLYNP